MWLFQVISISEAGPASRIQARHLGTLLKRMGSHKGWLSGSPLFFFWGGGWLEFVVWGLQGSGLILVGGWVSYFRLLGSLGTQMF